MDPPADDGGGPPTALAGDPGAQAGPAAVPPQPTPRLRTARPRIPRQRTSRERTAQPGDSAPLATRQDLSDRDPSHQDPSHQDPGHQDPSHQDSRPGQAPTPRRPTDGVAVAALVSGIVAAIPVTLVLGPLALIRVGRSRARGRALAITGLVLAGLWTVAAALIAAAIITRPPPPKPVTLPHVFSLRAGECLNSGTSGISGVQVLSCTQPHDAEVFATFQVAGTHYPGATALHQRASQGCVSRLSGYLNPQLSTATLAQSFVYPGAGAWSAGERTVVCTVRSTSGPLVGSVRSAPR